MRSSSTWEIRMNGAFWANLGCPSLYENRIISFP